MRWLASLVLAFRKGAIAKEVLDTAVAVITASVDVPADGTRLASIEGTHLVGSICVDAFAFVGNGKAPHPPGFLFEVNHAGVISYATLRVVANLVVYSR